MSRERKSEGSSSGAGESRADRLARQLRDNLRKRKAQARARAGTAGRTGTRDKDGTGSSADDG